VKSSTTPTPTGFKTYRTKLLVAMLLIVSAMTALGLFLAQRKVAIEARLDLLQDFQNELATLHSVQEMRHAALAERCRVLVSRPRIHAALEDNALDLLYPSAKDELRDILDARHNAVMAKPEADLHARFYRFLDGNGAVISPPPGAEVGKLLPTEEAQLALPSLNNKQQSGYLLCGDGTRAETLHEVLAMPIVSTESGEVIAALVLGFEPVEFGRDRSDNEIKSGIWSNNRLHLSALMKNEQDALARELTSALANRERTESNFDVKISGMPYLLFCKQLNPDSLYAPAYEVAVYPLANAMARQEKIRAHVVLAGLALLLAGTIASHFISRRLSAPVEELAVTSEQNLTQRAVAEAALESTSVELQRAARFSADASHQLKTPVTVLRAGIEELLARDDFAPEVYHELSALLHQTYRITGVVDDLLLLSRMDAGRLQIQFGNVDLSQLLEEWIDDISALPDELHVQLETNFPPDLHVAGEKGYIALIVQNLLENARKYNLPGGKICVAAHEEDGFVVLSIENTGRPIPREARSHIFERFHRGVVGENVPGHGLGLNLARELARLHGGDLRLVRSDEEWTEFEVRFRVAKNPAALAATSA
jgi:signal transduction histidine kinase